MSRLAAGSSASSTGGSTTRTVASSTRARSPPDRVDQRRRPSVVSSKRSVACSMAPAGTRSLRSAPMRTSSATVRSQCGSKYCGR